MALLGRLDRGCANFALTGFSEIAGLSLLQSKSSLVVLRSVGHDGTLKGLVLIFELLNIDDIRTIWLPAECVKGALQQQLGSYSWQEIRREFIHNSSSPALMRGSWKFLIRPGAPASAGPTGVSGAY